jgi:hypothetical protein
MTDGLRRRGWVITAQIPEPLLFDPSISSHAKVVWALLNRRLDRREGSDTAEMAFPGRDWLSERMGVSVPTVDRAIVELEQLGWVTVDRPGGGLRNLYTLHGEAQQVITGEDHRSSQVRTSRSSQVRTTRKESKGKDSNGTKPPAATPSAPADGQLDLGASARGKPRAPKPETTAADRVTRAIWNARDPKPTASFMGVRAVVKRLQAVGWPDDAIVAAGSTAPVLTANAIELALNQARRPAPAANGRARGAEYDQQWRDAASKILNPNGAP